VLSHIKSSLGQFAKQIRFKNTVPLEFLREII
jgi:hypothetical protein